MVILGGTSGIGLAVARGAIDEGATVCIASKQLERLEKARADLAPADSVHLTTRTIDVASETAVKGFFEGIGPFDHLVFTAGDNLPLGPLVGQGSHRRSHTLRDSLLGRPCRSQTWSAIDSQRRLNRSDEWLLVDATTGGVDAASQHPERD